MSRILDHLRAYETDKRVHLPKPLKLVSSEVFTYEAPINYGIVYNVQAKLGAQVIVTEEAKQRGNWSQIIKEGVYRPLAEEIFGEFRQPLIDADFAIMQGEYGEASRLIKGVLDSMFKV